MDEQHPAVPPATDAPEGLPVLDRATENALAALLALDAASAAEIRERSPSRRRSQHRRAPQHGPELDLGADPC